MYSAWWNGRQSGIRDKTGEGLDGSGDGIRAGARRDENRERMGGGGDKMGDGVIWERRWNLG